MTFPFPDSDSREDSGLVALGIAGVLLLGGVVLWLYGPANQGDSRQRPDPALMEFEGGGDDAEACRSRRGGSRWARAGEYRRAGTFGGSEDQWLTADMGTAVGPGGRLFVYDPEAPRIVSLTPDLASVRYIGEEGPGPGQLESVPAFTVRGKGRDWLARGDSTIYVYHGRAISEFTPDGRYVGDVASFRPPGSFLTLHSIAFSRSDSSLLYAHDPRSAVSSRRGETAFTTWRVDGDGLVRLFDVKLPALPAGAMSASFTGPNEALPLWDVHQGCVAATDGAEPWIVRFQLSSGRIDTLPLPDVEPAPATVPERTRRSMERMQYMRGRGGGGLPEPAARARWDAMSVDPDGHLWLLPARDERQGPPFDAVVLSLETGETTARTVPAFPRAFGRPGEFYSVRRDTTLDVAVVERWRADGE